MADGVADNLLDMPVERLEEYPREQPGDAGSTAVGKRIYTNGSLRYTLGGLVILFIWLLWGDFCATMYGVLFGNFFPLYLHHLRASNTVIAMLTTGIGGAVNLLFLPNISMATDRYRSRWGRRIPFLFWSTPVAVLGFIAIGYSSQISRWLHGAIGPLQAFSIVGITVSVLSIIMVGQTLFQMVTNNVYQFLLRDVVPQEVMPWFLSLFRVVGVVAGAFFSWFLFRYIVSHPKIICTGMGLIYLASFLLICWRVKEGDYPPPQPQPARGRLFGGLSSYFRYFRECLSVGIYRNYIFVFVLLITATNASGSFIVLFGTKTLGISAKDYGKILAVATLICGPTYLLMGYLCRRFHPIPVALFSVIALAIGPVFAFCFVRNEAGWLAYSIAMALPGVGWGLAYIAVMMMLFPADQFGKFSSSLMTIGWGSLALTSYLVGKFMDLAGGNYRMIFVVMFACTALAIVPMAQVYRGWKSHGGPDNYVPPLPRTAGATGI